jgi:hypothetical protein
MIATNGLIAIYLARRFGAQTFSQYVLITAAVSSLTLLTRGIQSSIAHSYAFDTLQRSSEIVPSRYIGEFRSIKVGVTLAIIWLLFTPILSYLGHLPLAPTVSAVAIIPIASLGALVSGRMQGTRKFFEWRISLLITTLIQGPLVFAAATLHAPLSVFILILAIPTAVYALIRIRNFRPSNADIVEEGFSLSLAPGVTSALSMLGSQLPLLLVRHNFLDDQIGPLMMFIYGMGILSGISATLGSYLLPKFVQSRKLKTADILIRTHILHATPLIAFFTAYIIFGSNLTRIAVGSQYVLATPVMTLTSALLCFFIWAVQSSLLQERMSVVTWMTSVVVALSVCAEAIALIVIQPSLIPYFLIHAMFGLVTLFALNVTIK